MGKKVRVGEEENNNERENEIFVTKVKKRRSHNV